MSWISRWFRRARLERELDAELAFHLEQHTRDLIAAGVPAAEARRRARIALGGLEQVKEEARDVRGTRWIEDLGADVRFAFRMLRKSPGFAAAAVLTLAVGIGANTAVFSVADALFLRRLPVEKPDQLFYLDRAGLEGQNDRFSGPALERMRAALPPGASLAGGSREGGMYLTIDRTPERITGQLVTGGWFGVLGVQPAVGRVIGPQDNVTLDGHPVVVLSYPLWTRRFGADPAVIGRTVRINGAPLTVIGVAQAGFTGIGLERVADLWIPAVMQTTIQYYSNASIDNSDEKKPWLPQEGVKWLTLIGRAPPEAPLPLVASRLSTVFNRDRDAALASADSGTRAVRSRVHLALASAATGFSDLRKGLGDPIKILTITVALVLLVACANLAGLLLARNAARDHELAVRVSLGARGGRLVRQVLTESLVLALLGGAASLAVAWVGATALLQAAWAAGQPLPVALGFNWRLLAVAGGISLATGILFGLPPALRIGRTDWALSFRTAGRVVSGGPGQSLLGRGLVVGQIGLSLALVVIAGVLVRSVQSLMAVDPGYDRASVLSARIEVRGAGYRPEDLPALYRRIEETIAGVPGVSMAALGYYGLGTGSSQTSSIEVPGKVRPPGWQADVQVNAVSRRYLETAGLKLLRGRSFAETDVATSPKVAVLTESMARRFFDTDNPVGMRFGYDDKPIFEVIGVVADVRPNELRAPPNPMMFLSLEQEPGTMIYNALARVTGSPTAVAQGIKTALAAAEPGLPIREIVTVATLLERGVRSDQMVSRVTGIFGALAALLAAIGLYGVMSYSVARRGNELGVRLALGAAPSGLRWLVIGDSMKLVVTGVVVGLGVLFLSLSLVARLVYGVSPRDPVSIAGAVLVLLTVGLAAAAIPAWRASRVDPVTALRRD